MTLRACRLALLLCAPGCSCGGKFGEREGSVDVLQSAQETEQLEIEDAVSQRIMSLPGVQKTKTTQASIRTAVDWMKQKGMLSTSCSPLVKSIQAPQKKVAKETIGTSAGGKSPRIYVYENAGWISPEDLLECYTRRTTKEPVKVKGRTVYVSSHATSHKMPWQTEKEDAQNSGDIWLYYAFRNHTSRTRDPEKADVFFVPFLARISSMVGYCAGTKHHWDRVKQFKEAIQKQPHFKRNGGSDHLLVCQSWSCQNYLKGIAEVMGKGYLAIHERNPKWGKQWDQDRMIMIPYVANYYLLEAEKKLSLESKKASTSFNIFYAAGHAASKAILWSGCNRATYSPLAQDPRNVLFIPSKGEVKAQVTQPEWALKIRNDPALDKFQSYAKIIERSRFCLLGCGDTATTRRMSDAMAAGSIPLFPDWRWFKEEEGADYGKSHWGWRVPNEKKGWAHMPFTWKVDYSRLSVLVPEVAAQQSHMTAVQHAVNATLADPKALAAKQAYVFEVRDDLIYGWGSPEDAANGIEVIENYHASKSLFLSIVGQSFRPSCR